jgi:uncharacterized protein (DUF2141 family)
MKGAVQNSGKRYKMKLGFLTVSAGRNNMKRFAAREAAVACRTKIPKTLAGLAVQFLTWLVVLTPVCSPAASQAATPCPGIHVKILDIKNSKGTIACALFESSVGFPTEYLHSATNIMVIKIRDKQARCDFEDMPKGTYALAVVHDENMNGKLDTNFLGIPTEGYGFSNDAKGVIGAPSFSAARFPYDGQDLDLTISLHY